MERNEDMHSALAVTSYDLARAARAHRSRLIGDLAVAAVRALMAVSHKAVARREPASRQRTLATASSLPSGPAAYSRPRKRRP